jgi:hypothetical protein
LIEQKLTDLFKEFIMDCNCRQCRRDRNEMSSSGFPIEMAMMIVCDICGNKRCPHAENHKYKCTNSNELNQVEEE